MNPTYGVQMQMIYSLKRALLALFVLWPLASAAAVTELDRVVAIVEDDVVLDSELKERLVSLKNQYATSDVILPPDEILREQVLERLILDSIQYQVGNRLGIRINDEDLTGAVTAIAQQNSLTLAEFRHELEKQRVDYRSFREQMRRDLVIREVQRFQINSRIHISAKEVERFLASPAAHSLSDEDYLVGHILISLNSLATNSVRRETEQEAQDIYAELKDGVEFRQLAIEHSDAGNALEGGSLGWRKRAALPELFSDQVATLKIGETLPPIKSSSGFHIVSLLDKKGGVTEQAQQTKVRHILIRTSEIFSQEEASDLIQSLHAQIVAGGDFAALAKRYSKDPGSALVGGDLGWVYSEALDEEFAQQMNGAAIGGLTAPFQSTFGWHILEVLERRDVDITQEQLEQRAVSFLKNRRFDEEFQNFLTETRNEAFVEIK